MIYATPLIKFVEKIIYLILCCLKATNQKQNKSNNVQNAEQEGYAYI